ncbi:MAG: YadA-like family protein [Tardiphaga sp.]
MTTLAARGSVASVIAALALTGGTGRSANAAVVSACTGVSLPPSVVTGLLGPVLTDLTGALGGLGGILNLLPTVTSINNGAPISLQVLDVNGNAVSNTAPCITTATNFQLTNPAGIAFGGNQITGLGNGTVASAGEINSIAIGNNAVTSNTATGAIAIGTGANVGAVGGMALGSNAAVTSANSVALGANAVAGAANGGWAGTTIGGTTITSNVLTANAVVGVSGGGINRQITGVADGAVNATSTDAINGSQLFYSIQALTTAIAASVPLAADNVNGLPAPTVAPGQNGVAVGYGGTSTGTNSVALGNGSSDGGRANVVSVGTQGATRQVINVTAGTQATDAVNVAQLQPLVTALGGGTTFNSITGAVTGPTYNVGGTNYGDVGSALAATNRLSVQYTADANGNPTNGIVLSGANNGQPVSISNVAAGVNGTDAVNVNQLRGVSSRVDQLASSINGLSGAITQNQTEARRGIATTAAMANLPFGTTPGRWSPAISFGGFKDQAAVAMGVQYNAAGEYRVKLRATASIVPNTGDVTFGGGAGMEF